MAKASFAKIEKVVVKEEEGVSLLLTMDEARTLRDIMARISGSPEGRRGHTDAISNALDAIGLRFESKSMWDMIGNIDIGKSTK